MINNHARAYKKNIAQHSDLETCLPKWREEFHNNPLRVIQIPNFIKLGVRDALYMFLNHEAHFTEQYAIFDKKSDISVSDTNFETWNQTAPSARFKHYKSLSSDSSHKASLNLMQFMQFRHFLTSVAFRQLLEYISGIKGNGITDTQIHAFQPGHYLRPHNDNIQDRRLAYIFYMSRDWQDEFGGELVVEGNDDELQKFRPLFNSLIIFDVKTHKRHYTAPITEAAKDYHRYTIGGWTTHKDTTDLSI